MYSKVCSSWMHVVVDVRFCFGQSVMCRYVHADILLGLAAPGCSWQFHSCFNVLIAAMSPYVCLCRDPCLLSR